LTSPAPSPAAADGSRINVLDLVPRLIELHVLQTGMAGLLPRRHTGTRRQGRLDRPPARAV